MTSNKVQFSIEANEASAKFIASKGYILALNGTNMATMTKEFVLTAYVLTKNPQSSIMSDVNKIKPLYKI